MLKTCENHLARLKQIINKNYTLRKKLENIIYLKKSAITINNSNYTFYFMRNLLK